MCNLIRTQLTQLTQISANENVWQLNTDEPLNPNYAIHCSAFTINNGCANVRQWLRQAYSPPNGDIAFSPTLRFRSSPFEGITSPLRSAFPPLKGGRGDVPLRSVFCHSERSDESPPFPREIPHYVRNDKGGSKSIFIQAYSPQKNKTGESIPHPCGMGLK